MFGTEPGACWQMAVAAGTTTLRTHVEVDQIVGLMGLEAVLPLREEFAAAIDVQICAFAQEGIVRAPGTEALLRRALAMGADLVGGCPYNDSDPLRQIQIVYDLADEFGVAVDFHADFFDEPEHLHITTIVEETLRRGWQGRVVVGHLTELAALAPHQQDRIIAGLVEARIGVISLPATDLYLMGRRDTHNIRRRLTPIRRLLAAGVPVAISTNNVQNPFTPVGTADLDPHGLPDRRGRPHGHGPPICGPSSTPSLATRLHVGRAPTMASRRDAAQTWSYGTATRSRRS